MSVGDPERDEDITRRAVLGSIAGGVGAGSGLKYMNDSYEPENDNYDIFRDEELTTITDGNYRHDILYGTHFNSENKERITADLDGIFLETGFLDASPERLVNALEDSTQYEEILNRAKEHDIPVYLTDINPGKKKAAVDISYQFATFTGGTFVARDALTSIQESTSAFKASKNVSKLSAGLWLQSPVISSGFRLPSSYFEIGEELSGEMKKASERVRPDVDKRLLKLRNIVGAQKQQSVINKEDQNNPHYMSVWGANHVGFEDAIQYSSERRENYLNSQIEDIKEIQAFDRYRNVQETQKVEHDNEVWIQTDSFEEEHIKSLLEQ